MSTLTISQQQMVEIARALSHEAKVVIMDEPTSALTPNEIRSLFEVIRRLKDLGIGILYVTHKLEEVFELCDRVTVFRDGQLVSSRPVAETNTNAVVTDMVGRSITTLFPRTHAGRGEPVLDRARPAHREQAQGGRASRCTPGRSSAFSACWARDARSWPRPSSGWTR